MHMPTDRECQLVQIRFEDVMEGSPAHIFRSDGRVFFPMIATNGSITARLTSFIFWKKNREWPAFNDDPRVQFPNSPGISRFEDGTIMFTMHFSPMDFLQSSLMVNALKDGLRQLENAAGDEWDK